MALPKVIIRYTDWMGTLGILAVFSVICAYFLAYYDKQLSSEPKTDLETPFQINESQTQDQISLSVTELSITLPPEEGIQQQGSAVQLCEVEIVKPSCVYSCQPDQAALNSAAVNEATIPESFDEQLELAFRLKEQQNFYLAAKLFQKVLESNRNSEAAPLVILQIADSLKYAGEYQQAINILTDSLSFSAANGKMAVEPQIHELLTKLQQLEESKKTGGSIA
jgi:tetratricopeptide (TPR) repeat protein